MLPITAETIDQFAPTYVDYETRRTTAVEQIGVESPKSDKDFRQAIMLWNEQSKIGWTTAEQEMLALIYAEEAANGRFHGNIFMRAEFGGNTAEHPIFAGMKIDAQRDASGYGPSDFAKLDMQHKLASTKLCQEQHAMIAVHDIGELVDITVDEARDTGALKKEPPEEKLVGPFKIRLAAYALSTGNPSLYGAILQVARERIKIKKAELLADARARKISGDDFVLGVGQEIGRIMNEVQDSLAHEHGQLEDAFTPEIAAAEKDMSNLFKKTQEEEGFDCTLHTLFDKMEGDAHFRHFIGRMKTAPTKDTPLHTRLFQNGEALSFHLASSQRAISAMTYSQKTIPLVLAAAQELQEGAEKDVAMAFARNSSAALIRNQIRILQKSAPVLDLTGKDTETAALTADADKQAGEFARRVSKATELKQRWTEKRHVETVSYPVTKIADVIDTKTLIAVLEKAAQAIETGAWMPTKADLPIGLGELPKEIQPSFEDVKNSAAKYPLEVKDAYKSAGVRI